MAAFVRPYIKNKIPAFKKKDLCKIWLDTMNMGTAPVVAMDSGCMAFGNAWPGPWLKIKQTCLNNENCRVVQARSIKQAGGLRTIISETCINIFTWQYEQDYVYSQGCHCFNQKSGHGGRSVILAKFFEEPEN